MRRIIGPRYLIVYNNINLKHKKNTKLCLYRFDSHLHTDNILISKQMLIFIKFYYLVGFIWSLNILIFLEVGTLLYTMDSLLYKSLKFKNSKQETKKKHHHPLPAPYIKSKWCFIFEFMHIAHSCFFLIHSGNGASQSAKKNTFRDFLFLCIVRYMNIWIYIYYNLIRTPSTTDLFRIIII